MDVSSIYKSFLNVRGTLIQIRKIRNCGNSFHKTRNHDSKLVEITHLIKHLNLMDIFDTLQIFVQEDDERHWGIIYLYNADCRIYKAYKSLFPEYLKTDGIVFKHSTIKHSHLQTCVEDLQTSQLSGNTYSISVKISTKCYNCDQRYNSTMCKRIVYAASNAELNGNIQLLKHSIPKQRAKTISQRVVLFPCAATTNQSLPKMHRTIIKTQEIDTTRLM